MQPPSAERTQVLSTMRVRVQGLCPHTDTRAWTLPRRRTAHRTARCFEPATCPAARQNSCRSVRCATILSGLADDDPASLRMLRGGTAFAQSTALEKYRLSPHLNGRCRNDQKGSHRWRRCAAEVLVEVIRATTLGRSGRPCAPSCPR